jgi:hypothetical protein
MTNMEYRIETTGPKKLIGIRMKMSLAGDNTWKLWHSFSIYFRHLAAKFRICFR